MSRLKVKAFDSLLVSTLYSVEGKARSWMRARGKRKPIFSVPVPFPVFKAMGSGKLTSVTAERIGGTWEAWLSQHLDGAASDQRSLRPTQ